jgi:hypothetical protein
MVRCLLCPGTVSFKANQVNHLAALLTGGVKVGITELKYIKFR